DGRTRCSNFWAPTGGIAVAEEGEDNSTAMLKRAGFVRQSHSGVFHLMPLGLKVQEKLERLIDNAMQSIGASKLSLSSISSEGLWEKSGRLAKYPELLRIKDRKDSRFILSPTHEEEITELVSPLVKSYKDLPLRLYQISRKYRDELRPRQGLLRAKEFLMKDLYTFDTTPENALQTYLETKAAYERFFDSLGLGYVVAEADSGAMGGTLSHEYQFISPIGEDTVVRCTKCDFIANEEVLPSDLSDGIRSATATEEPRCPKCSKGSLRSERAIEVGHTFHLGTRYSEPLNVTVADLYDQQVPLQMGCHGIGISRIIAAATSLLSTDKGLRWPFSLAPFKVVVMDTHGTEDDAMAVYDALSKPHPDLDDPGVLKDGEIILDDRDKSLGWKLKDADLIGYPIAIILGKKWKETGCVDI
ncbi:class II aaRS and biotin synthetase, partial [Rhizodiscina lignyota]